METAISIYDQLQDLLGDNARTPHFYLDYVGYTNGYFAGLIPKDNIDIEIKEPLDYSRALKGIGPKIEVIYTLNELENALSHFKTYGNVKEVFETCKECSGEGYIECECCGSEPTCKRCQGEGEVLKEIIHTGRIKYKTDDGYLMLKSAVVDPNLLHALIESCKILGISDKLFVMTHNSGKKASVFEVSDCKFLIMPVDPLNSKTVTSL